MMNVFQKINEVKKVVKVFERDDRTSGKGAYTFVSGAQILSAIKDKMEELGLLFLPVETEHRGWTTFDYKNSYGEVKTDFVVDGKLVYEWINCDDPNDRQRVSFEYYGQQNDISKAFGSALTYSERYLLLKSLGVPTSEDDPDNNDEDKSPRKAPQGQSGKGKSEKPTTTTKSKWAQVNDLIKDTDITIPQVTEWIIKKYKKDIKINNLTDEQFNALVEALKKKLGGGDE